MKKHYLTYIGGFAAVLAVGAWTYAPTELDLDNLAEAADGNQTITVECGSTSVNAYVPSVTYTLSFPAASSTSFSAGDVTVSSSLGTSAVNGEMAPTANVSDDVSGFVTIAHAAPLSKLGGLQCQSAFHYAKLDAAGSDNSPDLHVMAKSLGTSSWGNAENNADRIDVVGGKVLFGFNGVISSSHLQDGSDSDGAENGEIAFGTSNSNGAHSLLSLVRYMGTDLSSASETIVYTFSPEAAAN